MILTTAPEINCKASRKVARNNRDNFMVVLCVFVAHECCDAANEYHYHSFDL